MGSGSVMARKRNRQRRRRGAPGRNLVWYSTAMYTTGDDGTFKVCSKDLLIPEYEGNSFVRPMKVEMVKYQIVQVAPSVGVQFQLWLTNAESKDPNNPDIVAQSQPIIISSIPRTGILRNKRSSDFGYFDSKDPIIMGQFVNTIPKPTKTGISLLLTVGLSFGRQRIHNKAAGVLSVPRKIQLEPLQTGVTSALDLDSMAM